MEFDKALVGKKAFIGSLKLMGNDMKNLLFSSTGTASGAANETGDSYMEYASNEAHKDDIDMLNQQQRATNAATAVINESTSAQAVQSQNSAEAMLDEAEKRGDKGEVAKAIERLSNSLNSSNNSNQADVTTSEFGL